jgi:hypothetical protein
MELRRVRRPEVADSHHFEEELDPNPHPHRSKSWIRIRIKVMRIRIPGVPVRPSCLARTGSKPYTVDIIFQKL